MIKKIIKVYICMLAIFCISATALANSEVYVWSNLSSAIPTSNMNDSNVQENNSLNLQSESAILIEQESGKILYSHNIHEQLRPASVTKIMSILLIMEQIDSGKLKYEDRIQPSSSAASMGGSQIWLDTTETLSVDEMLKAICVVSANDCVMAMAEHIGGSEEAFVDMMNKKAQELGMQDTTFKNCHGIDEDGHVTSSYDIALMSRELLTKHPSITKYTTIWMDSLRDGKSELVNTNKLIRNYSGATGLKTGSTSLALFNLSASAERNNLKLIAVIMRAPSSKVRFEEATKLLNYGFANFTYTKFAERDTIVKTIQVDKGVQSNLDCIIGNESGILIKKGEEKNIVEEINMQDRVQAPINKSDVVGEIKYTLNGEEVGKINIIAKNSIDKINILTMTKHTYYKWFTLLRT